MIPYIISYQTLKKMALKNFICGVFFSLMFGQVIVAEGFDTKAEIESLKRRFDSLEASLGKVISIFHSYLNDISFFNDPTEQLGSLLQTFTGHFSRSVLMFQKRSPKFLRGGDNNASVDFTNQFFQIQILLSQIRRCTRFPFGSTKTPRSTKTHVFSAPLISILATAMMNSVVNNGSVFIQFSKSRVSVKLL